MPTSNRIAIGLSILIAGAGAALAVIRHANDWLRYHAR